MTLRAEVREFVHSEMSANGYPAHCDAWMTSPEPAFSRSLGARGWIGMTFPTEFGGSGSTAAERFVVSEELLAAGAPVAAHWFADRQVGPALLRHGTPEQRESFLPQIARGECYFAIGMSEPDSGSDLASVRTHAERTAGGWVLNGAKLWTSHAHTAHQMLTLVRTAPGGQSRHEGLSQFIVDLSLDGIEIRPVLSLDGGHHFNQVTFSDVMLSEGALLGVEGHGWEQVNAELALERSGPERYLSTLPLLRELARRVERPSARLGQLLAELATIRAMSADIAEALGRGEAPSVRSAMVKDLGSRLERRVIDVARELAPVAPDLGSSDDYARLLAEATVHAPDGTLRGGANEILRGIVARTMVSA